LFSLLQKTCNIKKEIAEKRKADLKSISSDHVHKDLVNEIKDFIDKNYNKEALNIAMVGDYFNITPYYASNIFKKSEGHGMLDYIGKVRIEKAKELMNSDDFTIEAISREVGFANVRTFMRAFVKYENITPGKYKEMIGYKNKA